MGSETEKAVDTAPVVDEGVKEEEVVETNDFAALADDLLADDDVLDAGIVEEVVTEPAKEDTSEAAQKPTESQDELKGAEATGEPDPSPAEEVVKQEEESPAEEPAAKVEVEETSQAQYEQRRQTRVTELTQTYAIPEDMVESLQLNPEKVFPKLAAELHMQVMESVGKMMDAQMAGVMKSVQKQESDERQKEDAFYEAWPALKEQDRAAIDRMANNYRQLNPSVDQATLIREVGAQAAIAFKLPLDMETGKIKATIPDDVGLAPHQPAGVAGGAVAPAQVKAPTNDFTILSEELLEDDLKY